MREYKIKRGHNPNLDALITQYFGAKGDIGKGMQFAVEGIGAVYDKTRKKLTVH